MKKMFLKLIDSERTVSETMNVCIAPVIDNVPKLGDTLVANVIYEVCLSILGCYATKSQKT